MAFKYWKKTQLKCFKILNTMIEYSGLSFWSVFVIFCISSLQRLWFIVHNQFEEAWSSNTILELLQLITKIVTIFPLLSHLTYEIHLIIVYGIILFIILLGILFFVLYILIKGFENPITWPFKMMSKLFLFLTTIGYLPLYGSLFSIMDCNWEESSPIHSYHPEIECNSFGHVIHIIISGFIMICFWLVLIVMMFLFYSTTAKDAYGRYDSHSESIEMMWRLIILIEFTFIKSSANNWVLCGTMIIGSGVIYFYYYHNNKFVDPKVYLVWKYFFTLQIWSEIILALALLLKKLNFTFTAGLELMICGAPLLLISISKGKEADFRLMLQNLQNLKNSSEAALQINILKTIILSTNNKKFSMLMSGFIDIHMRICDYPECSITEYYKKQKYIINKMITMSHKMTPIMRSKIRWLPKRINLTNFLNDRFRLSLQRFSGDNRLRIHYIQFLLESFNNLSYPLAQIELLERMELSFEDSFLVFRFKHLVRKKLIHDAKMKDQSSQTLLNIIKYEEHFEKFKNDLEKCAIAQMHFLSALEEITVQMHNLSQNGFRINKLIKRIYLNWEQMEQLNPNSPSALRLFGLFHERILIEPKKALNMYKRIIESSYIKQNKLQTNLDNVETYSKEGLPAIFVSGLLNKEGIIQNCNLALCNLMGQEKNQMIGNHIESIIPDLLQGTHQQILRRAAQKGEFAKDKHVFCRVSGGYIKSVFLKVISGPSLLNGSNFICQLIPNKKAASTYVANIIVDNNKVINSISSSCLYLFGLTPQLLKVESIHIETMLPELTGNLFESKFFGLEKKKTRLLFSRSILMPSDQEFIFSPKKNKVQEIDLLCSIEELRATGYGTLGFIITLEFPKCYKYGFMESEKRPQFPFEMIFSPNFKIYLRTHVEEDQTKNLDSISPHLNNERKRRSLREKMQNILIETEEFKELQKQFDPDSFESGVSLMEEININNSFDDIYWNLKKFQSSSFYFRQIIPKIGRIIRIGRTNIVRFGFVFDENFKDLLKRRLSRFTPNIPTKRLVEQSFIDVTAELNQVKLINIDLEEEFCEEDKNEKKKSLQEKKGKFFLSHIKSREYFQNALIKSANELPILFLKVLLLLLFLGIMILLIIDQINFNDVFANIVEEIELIEDTFSRTHYIMNTMFHVRELCILEQGYDDSYLSLFEVELEEYKSWNWEELEEYREEITLLEANIVKKTQFLHPNSNYDLYTSKRNTPLYYQIQNEKRYEIVMSSLHESVQKFLSEMTHIIELENTDGIYYTNPHFYFLFTNAFGEFLNDLNDASFFYTNEFKNSKSLGNSSNLLQFILSSFGVIIFMGGLCIFGNYIENESLKVMTLFFQVPSKYVFSLKTSAEQFIKAIHYDEDIGSSSSIADNNSTNEIQFNKYYSHKRGKKYIHFKLYLKKMVIFFGVVFVLIETIFFLVYYLNSQLSSTFVGFIETFNSTLQISPVFFMALNIERELFFDEEAKIMDQNSTEVILHLQQKLNLISDFSQMISDEEINLIGETNFNKIYNILKGNICEEYNLMEHIKEEYVCLADATCDTFFDGIVSQGLILVFSKYIQTIKSLLFEYFLLKSQIYDENELKKEIFHDSRIPDLHQLLEKIIIPMNYEIIGLTMDGINETHSARLLNRIIMVLVLFFLMMISYFGFWFSFLSSFKHYNQETKKMLQFCLQN